MVVDDEPEHCRHLAANLKNVGVKQILSATSGKEAFAILGAQPRPVDLLLTDVQMPEGNGLQLLQAVRIGNIKGMRLNATVVLATTTPTVGIIQTASALDANGFVVKPINADKFEATILKARRTLFPPSPQRHAEVYIPDEV